MEGVKTQRMVIQGLSLDMWMILGRLLNSNSFLICNTSQIRVIPTAFLETGACERYIRCEGMVKTGCIIFSRSPLAHEHYPGVFIDLGSDVLEIPSASVRKPNLNSMFSTTDKRHKRKSCEG